MDDRSLTVLVVPEGARETRTYQLTHRQVRLLTGGAISCGVLLLALLGSWAYFAVRASRVSGLEAQVAQLLVEQERVDALVVQLTTIEAAYDRIRGLFGTEAADAGLDLWLPVPGGGTGRSAAARASDQSRPTSWPLSVRGFVTQPLIDGDAGDHPGLDIAVPTDTYIRASGGGVVAEAGEDPVYGRFVVVEHEDGYRTVYGHASLLLVETGQNVRQNEVIALSGSTGRSTAPHLHFEVLKDGQPIDPLTLIEQP